MLFLLCFCCFLQFVLFLVLLVLLLYDKFIINTIINIIIFIIMLVQSLWVGPRRPWAASMASWEPWMGPHAWLAPLQISIGASPPLVVQTSPALIQLLLGIHLEEWVDVLANLGVTEVPDLQHLTDAELSATGMRLVHLRKLRAAAGPPAPEAGIPVQLAALPISYGDNDEGPTEAANQAAKMEKCAAAAQTIASKALATALALSGRDKVQETIMWVKERVDDNTSSPGISASALIATSRALASCLAGDLNAALVIAERLVRDVLIWRVQLHSPLGDRCSFVACLMAAVGATNIDANMFSQLIQSHSKEVCSRFPNAVFNNANKESVKRRGRRTVRTRPKNNLSEALGNKEQEVEVEVKEHVEDEEYVEGEVKEHSEEEFAKQVQDATEAFLQHIQDDIEEHEEEEFPNQMWAKPLPGVAAAWLGSSSSLATGHQAVAWLGPVDHQGREAARKAVLAVVKQLSVEEAVEVLEQAKKEVLEQAVWRS